MRAGVNLTPSLRQAPRGHELRYLQQLLAAMHAADPNTRCHCFTSPANHDALAPWPRTLVEGAPPKLRLPGRAAPLDRAVREAHAEVLLSPLACAPATAPVPQVLFALDTAPFEAGASPRPAEFKAVRKACAAARALVVTSEYLRRRCLDLFEAPLDKIVVAPPGVTPESAGPQPSLVEPPYVLLIQDELTAAALPALTEVFGKGGKYAHLAVVVIGQWEPDEARWGGNVMHIEQCSGTHLAGLCQHAACCIYPAEHDGSALRVLEALQAGALVATANTGAIKEHAGSAPYPFSPANGRSLLQALERLLGFSEEERRKRIRLGQQSAARFSWDKAAWKVLGTLKRA